MMTISLKKYQSVYIIELKGELDLSNVDKLKATVDMLIENKIRHVILDLSRLEYLDSSGVGSLVYIKNALEKTRPKTSLMLVQLTGVARKVVELARLIDFFRLSDDLKGAVLLMHQESEKEEGLS
jgi:anti-anti-sigma factor